MVGASLGAFFDQIMEPYVKERQQQKFFEGFTAAQSGVALNEISKSNGGFNKIFGPTAYAQGAQFYSARQAITDWTTARYDELDTLKKLPPKEAARVLATTSRSMMTGDAGADQLIQAGLIEQSGPLLNAVSKARYAWGQEQALTSTTSAWNSGATALQSAATAQARLSDPTDEQSSAFVAQGKAFLGSMQQPVGMDDETYRNGLFSFMRNAAQSGNFYAVRLLHQAGIAEVLTEDQRTKLEDAEHRYGQRTLQQFMASDEGFQRMALDYEGERAKAAYGAAGAMTAMQANQRLADMNKYVSRMTGIDEPVFDFSATKGEVRSMADLAVQARLRADTRAQQIADRDLARADRRAERAQDNADASAAAGLAWASGDVNGAKAGGVEEKYFDQIALTEFRSGNVAGMARSFRVSHFVSSAVRNDILAKVEGSLDEQYGKNMETAHAQWQAMYKANPGMTAAYYGDYNEKMRTFDTLARKLGPEAAYTRAFGDTSRYSSASVPPEFRRKADKAVTDTVAGQQPNTFTRLFRTPFSGTAVNVMQNLVRERVAMGIKNSDTPPEVLAPEALNAAMADGSLQVAGGQAWRAAPGTKPFRMQIGTQQAEADTVFRQVVDARLKARGFAAGINSELDINYVNAPGGTQALHVVARTSDGTSQQLVIPMTDFKDTIRSNYRAAHPQFNRIGVRVDSQDAQLYARGIDAGALRNFRQKPPKDWQKLPIIHPEHLRPNN